MTAKRTLHLGRHEVGKHGFVLLDLTHVIKLFFSRSLPIDGILGADFLKKNKAMIDYRNRKLMAIIQMPFLHLHP